MNKIIAKALIKKDCGLQIVPVEMISKDKRISEIHLSQNNAITHNGVLIPAFFNMHSHLGESIFRSIEGSDWNISKYLKYTEQYNSNLSKEQKDATWGESARYSAEKMSEQGTVGFCAARSTDVAADYGLLTMSGYPIMNSCKLADYKEAGISGFQSYMEANKNTTNRIGIFLHSVYANDDDSFKLARQCLDKGAEFITVHVSEDVTTTKLEKQKQGISAIEILKEYGLLSYKTILVHCGCCTDEDLNIVKESGAIICVCPISNKFLNTKIVDLYRLEEMGIPWCIATDGLGTGRTFSLLKQIEFVKKCYPDISFEKYWDSITRIPGMIFNNSLYTGDIEVGTYSSLVKTEYEGNDVNELLKKLMEGKIGITPIKV